MSKNKPSRPNNKPAKLNDTENPINKKDKPESVKVKKRKTRGELNKLLKKHVPDMDQKVKKVLYILKNIKLFKKTVISSCSSHVIVQNLLQ